MRLEIILKFVK